MIFCCLQNGITALRNLRCLEELNISHLEAVTSESVEEALGKDPRPTLKWLNIASLDLQWSVVASIADMAPNLTHLDVSMCITGINDKSVQVLVWRHSSFKQRCPLGSSYLVGRVLSIGL